VQIRVVADAIALDHRSEGESETSDGEHGQDPSPEMLLRRHNDGRFRLQARGHGALHRD
jgi:hypothetical protein